MKFYLNQILVDNRFPESSFFDEIVKKWSLTKPHQKKDTVYVFKHLDNQEDYFGLQLRYGNNKNYSPEVVDIHSNSIQQNPRTPNQVEPSNDIFIFYIKTNKQLLIYPDRNETLLHDIFSLKNHKIQLKRVFVSFDEFTKSTCRLKEIKLVTEDSLFSDSYDLNQEMNSVLGFGENLYPFKIEVDLKRTPLDRVLSQLQRFNEDYESHKLKNLVIIGEDDKGFDSVFNGNQFNKHIKIEVKKDETNQYRYSEVVQKIKERYGIQHSDGT